MLKNPILLFLTLSFIGLQAQEIPQDSIVLDAKSKNLKFSYKHLIIPGVLIGYGAWGLKSDQLIGYNRELRNEINENHHGEIGIDDFSRYAPVVAVYGLNAAGIKGKNNFKDRTVIMMTSYVIMSTTVFALKGVVKSERPDQSSFTSFPSGHTAVAFAGAEFMWQEYKDQSVWYGIAGYTVAAGTGVFRMYNNKHWLSDVAAGAGIGILSTKIAYWAHPYVNDLIFGSKETKTKTVFVPFYNGEQVGFGMAMTF